MPVKGGIQMKTLGVLFIGLWVLVNICMIKELISPSCCKFAPVSFDNCCQNNLRPAARNILIIEISILFIGFCVNYLP